MIGPMDVLGGRLDRQKRAAWLWLAAGLAWLPGASLSMNSRHGTDNAFLVPLKIVAGIICLALSIIGFIGIRRNPEGKASPKTTALSGPHPGSGPANQ